MKLIIVSGLSGSGKSICLHTLEDLDYYCIDNLPLNLLRPFAMQMLTEERPAYRHAAVGIDARNTPHELLGFPELLREIKTNDLPIELFFLQAEDETLLKRFSETRRKHPLSGRDVPLAEAIRLERELLEPLSSAADLLIDTTHTNVHQLRELVRERVDRRNDHGLSLLFQSFGFKHGVPGDVDFVFDLRCLPNPHWESRLRPYTGLQAPVIEFLEGQPEVEEMFQSIRTFLDTWIPRFEAENRSYMTIAVGCTGGYHRSVYMAERLAKHFAANRDDVLTRHRELT